LAHADSPHSVVELHLPAAAIDRQKVSELEDASTQPGICAEAGELLGALIDRVVLALNALRRMA
jgi:hypothetical protein